MNNNEFGDAFLIDLYGTFLGKTTHTEVALTDADYERAAETVRQWQTYLPSECVESMIRMGWHFTT